MALKNRVDSQRTFTSADVAAFAQLSGDYNPMHIDPVEARRTLFGECVAHGVFLLMWALESHHHDSNERRAWSKITAKFVRAVGVGSKVGTGSTTNLDGSATLRITSGERAVMEANVAFVQAPMRTSAVVKDMTPPRGEPSKVSLDSLSHDPQPMELHWDQRRGQQLFPTLANTQARNVLAALLAATRIVGMKMPGERSVFLQLDLTFSRSLDDAPFTYRADQVRLASKRLSIALAGAGCAGSLWALERAGAVAQPTMAAVRQKVADRRFAGRRILIVGGSRGLGEAAAKLVAAGGAEIAITYRLGRDDAERIVADIRAHGGHVKSFQLDIPHGDWLENLSRHASGFDHLCYFATPPIVEGDGKTPNRTLIERYAAVYVEGLELAAHWIAAQFGGQFWLFNASSMFVGAPPPKLQEYAAAKAESESVCEALAKSYPGARVYAARLPQLLTDQTAAVLSATHPDVLEVMLAELCKWLPQ